MKSFNAGTECTLNKPLFCPDNGETLTEYNFSISLGYKNAKRQTALKDISIIENLDCITDPENSLTYLG